MIFLARLIHLEVKWKTSSVGLTNLWAVDRIQWLVALLVLVLVLTDRPGLLICLDANRLWYNTCFFSRLGKHAATRCNESWSKSPQGDNCMRPVGKASPSDPALLYSAE